MVRYEYQVSLRVRHPSLDPAEITATLELKPFRAWRAGDARTTPKGRALKGTYLDTYWATRLADGEWPNKSLPAAIAKTINRLTPHRDFFHRVRVEGGRAEFFIGWEFDGNAGDVFDCVLLARMGDLKIDLSLDLYPQVRHLSARSLNSRRGIRGDR